MDNSAQVSRRDVEQSKGSGENGPTEHVEQSLTSVPESVSSEATYPYIITSLKAELAASKKQSAEKISQLEEQVKHLQAKLERYMYLEDKESPHLLLSSMATGSCQYKTSTLPDLTGMLERKSRTTSVLEPKEELAVCQHQIHELQAQTNQLREQLKKIEAEKQQLQAELGRYLFLEDKGRCNQKLQLLSRESGSDQSRPCAGSSSPALTSMDGRVLGGAGPIQESSSASLQTRLVPGSSSFTKFSDDSLSSNSSGSTSLASHSVCEAEQSDHLLQDLSDHSSGITSTNFPAAGYEISSDTKFSDDSLSSNCTDGTSLATHSICEAQQSDHILQDVFDHSPGIMSTNSPSADYEISSDTKFSDDSLSTNSSDSTSLATHSICEAQQSDHILHHFSNHSLGITSTTSPAAGCEISSDTGGVNTTSNEGEVLRRTQLLSNKVSLSGNGDAEVLEECIVTSEQMEERYVDLCKKTLRFNRSEQPGTFHLNSAEMNSPHSCSTARDGSGLLVAVLVTHSQYQTAVPGRLAAGVSSGSNTDWDRLGARPKQVQAQCPQPEPIPELIIPVSDGLASDSVARHTEDRTPLEGLYKDGDDAVYGTYSCASSSGSFGAVVTSSSTGFSVLGCANSNTLTCMCGPQPEPVPPEVHVMIPVSDGLASDFLARHTQDRSLLQGLCRDGDEAVYGTYSCASSSAHRSFGAVVTSISTGCSALDCALTVGPCCDDSDNNHSADFMLNRESGSHLLPLDDSLVALEQCTVEACAYLEEALREREERELFARQMETREQMTREQRERERREREEREVEQAEMWPQQQDAIFAPSPWLCNHYMRYCRVRFPCCTQFYPCHRCHNNSRACDNEEAEACHATHLKCSHCQHEQEFPADGKCSNCRLKMFPKFCSTCKHFISVDDNPCYCQICVMCGAVCSPSCGRIPEL